ncbi:MAG: acyl-[acyl-carrier-protein] thioesterase [Lachnospiraceae bacterium]
MYEMPCRIRFSETDKSGRLSMNGLLRLFQDCGYNHAIDRGYGLKYTERTHCTWYLLSWQIEAHRMPLVGEEVVMRTCIYDMQASLARKSIAMYDGSGECLATGDTMWVYMDVYKQEPVEPKDIPGREVQNDGEEGTQEGWLPEDYGDKIPMSVRSRRIIVPDDVMALKPCRVNSYLIDTNGHANNVRLTELAMSLTNADGGDCIQLRAEFKKQVKADSMIYPYIKESHHNDSNVITAAFRDEYGNTLTVFEFTRLC